MEMRAMRMRSRITMCPRVRRGRVGTATMRRRRRRIQMKKKRYRYTVLRPKNNYQQV
jgi:hypothetical protein